MRVRGMAVLAAAMLGYGTAPALARTTGSVPLGAVVALAKPYPNLLLEIRLQLLRANLKRDTVACQASELDTPWTKLNGVRLGPYTCRLGTRTLTVTTVPVYYDQRGKRLDARDPALAAKTTKVTETQLKWRWS